MKKTEILFTLICLLFAAVPALADEPVDENAMFSSDQTVVDSKQFEKTPVEDKEQKHVGFSGELTSVYAYSATREFLKGQGTEGDTFSPYIEGVGYLDVRLPDRIKGFGTFDAVYDPVDKTTEWSMKELFVDFNIDNTIYFRTGKQVVQWGRCYLWNPTDLVNVEKNQFITKVGPKEGTYGLKAHIPFGTSVNMYGFATTVGTDQVEDVAGAYKIEFVLGGSEMAFSVWDARGCKPVGGYDFSTRLFQIDIKGEASVSYGGNDKKLAVENGTLTTYRDSGKWIPKVCLDFGHAFDALDQTSKIQVNIEGFYNGNGYKDNIIDDQNTYRYDTPVVVKSGSTTHSFHGGSKAFYLLGNNVYQPNYLSRYYGALFVTVNSFFTSSMTLTMNLLTNISQQSYVASTMLSYQSLQGFKASIMVDGNFGPKNTEYTYYPVIKGVTPDVIRGGDIRLAAGIIF